VSQQEDTRLAPVAAPGPTSLTQSDPVRAALRTKMVEHRAALRNAVEDFQVATKRLSPERFILKDPLGVLLGAFCVGLAVGVFSKHSK
jgi:hypothetical protein